MGDLILGIVAKLAWSKSNWSNFDLEGSNNKEKYDYDFIKKFGYAHEWWNFYEGFNEDKYCGRVEFTNKEPAKEIRDKLILFISRNVYDGKHYFVGFYGGADFNKFDIDKKIIELLPKSYFETLHILERDEYLEDVLKGRKYDTNIQGLKSLSTYFEQDGYVEVQPDDIGISRFGRSKFYYIGEGGKCHSLHLIKLLKLAKGKHEEILVKRSNNVKKVKEIINKINVIIDKYCKIQYWQVALGKRAVFWEEAKRTSTISMGYNTITEHFSDNILKLTSYEDFIKGIEELYEKNKNLEKFKKYRTPQGRGSIGKQIWNFIYEMKEGDFVITNKGLEKIIGLGIIKSQARFDITKHYHLFRNVEWINVNLNIPIPNELVGKFGKTVYKLTEEEYDLIPIDIEEITTRNNEIDSKYYENISEIINYKKQLILYGPPGTGKTFIAKHFSDKYNIFKTYNLKNFQMLDRNFFCWVINPTNWDLIDDLLKNNKFYPLKFEEGTKHKNAFDEITQGDILFIYKTSPYKKINAIAECVGKENSNPKIKVVGTINGPKFSEMVNDTILSNSVAIRTNLQGSYFKFDKSQALRILEMIGIENVLNFEFFFEYSEKIDLTKFITFHQSYSYEEFIEGLRPKSDEEGKVRFSIQEGIFKKACRDALNILLDYCNINLRWENKAGPPDFDEKEIKIIKKVLKENNYPRLFFIIDEINRGDVSKIFGELITLLESDKRLFKDEEIRTILPYSKQKFGIPPNIYIIGTLNTADRSIALLDIALRRRFGFLEIMPDYECLENLLLEEELDDEIKKIRNLIISTIKSMNDRITNHYGRDHQIGHSYFLSLRNYESIEETKEQIRLIFISEILPLLSEYFYDQPKKVNLILNGLNIEDINKDIIAFLNKLSNKGEVVNF